MTINPDDLAAAYAQTHNAFQELTFLLERKGNITLQELAEIYGEDPSQAVPLFRADVVSERAGAAVECSHVAHTGSKIRVNKGKQSRAVVPVTSAQESAVVRERMSAGKAAAAYKRALQALEPLHSWHFWGIQEHVRNVRAEAASWRTKAQEAQRQVKLLEIELEEARRGAHE